MIHLGVSKNNGTPKSSTFIEFSIINDPFWGTPIFGNTHFLLKMLPFQDNRGPSELPVSSRSGKLHIYQPEAAQGSFCQGPPIVAKVPFLVG